METAKIEFATSRRPILIDAKRALYQLSYVPLTVTDLLNPHVVPGETTLTRLQNHNVTTPWYMLLLVKIFGLTGSYPFSPGFRSFHNQVRLLPECRG